MAVWLDTEVDVTVAGSWVDVDVSSYVPVGTTGVILDLRFHFGGASSVGVRKKGSTDALLVRLSAGHHAPIYIGVDANRIFQSYGFSSPNVRLELLGYFTTDAVFLTNGVDKTPGAVWEDADLSATLPAGSVAAIFIVGATDNPFSGSSTWGFRNNGSTDNRPKLYGQGRGVICGVDSGRVLEMYRGRVGIAIKLIGYLTQGLFKVNGLNKSTATVDSWQDVDMSADTRPDGCSMAVIESHNTSGGTCQFGFRKNGVAGSNYEVYYDGNVGAVGWAVGLDTGSIFEQYITDTIGDIYVIGYLIDPETAFDSSLPPRHGFIMFQNPCIV
jgi:hypothetical protein